MFPNEKFECLKALTCSLFVTQNKFFSHRYLWIYRDIFEIIQNSKLYEYKVGIEIITVSCSQIFVQS